MPPKKRIFKEDILEASISVIRKQSASALTVRNIAVELQSSTQPIYSEFQNLDCLKKECEYISNHGGKLYPGVGQLFQLLSPTVGLYIVSNCQDGYIQCFGRYTGLERYICDFECSGVTGLSKGENIRLIARRNFLRSPIYVGDTAMDEESARSAGVPFIHAAYGFGQALAPDAVIHNPLELLDIIEV